MKISGKKNLNAERIRAREEIDKVFLPILAQTMGQKFTLYQSKYHMAQTGILPMVEGIDVSQRYEALLQRVATVEEDRQQWQARIDNALTALEIEGIVKECQTTNRP